MKTVDGKPMKRGGFLIGAEEGALEEKHYNYSWIDV